MKTHTKVKIKAINLRKEGYSLLEIANILGIAKSTSSLWLRNISISTDGQKRIKERYSYGKRKAKEIRQQKSKEAFVMRQNLARDIISSINLNQATFKLCCALLFWCEGNKMTTQVKFTSSDPSLISIYLTTLRKGFDIDERKLRVLMHLHEYHDEKQQKEFWSHITGIRPEQFHKSFLKPHTGKRKHENYQGCIAVSYYSAQVAKELMAIYNEFVQRGIV